MQLQQHNALRTSIALVHRVRKKHPKHYRLSLEEELTDFINFSARIFLAQLAIK